MYLSEDFSVIWIMDKNIRDTDMIQTRLWEIWCLFWGWCLGSDHFCTHSFTQQVKEFMKTLSLFQTHPNVMDWYIMIVLWYLADAHFAPWELNQNFASKWHGTLCILTYFSSWHTWLPHTLYSSEHYSTAHFASQHTLLFSTLCSSAHFAPWNNLLHGKICSLEHFATYLEHFTLSGPGWWGGKVIREQCVPEI